MNKKLNCQKQEKNISQNNKLVINGKKSIKGITLIALVITVIVLIILARSKHSNFNRR